MMRVGIIGAGSMGRNHIRVCSRLPGVQLVGVADVDPRALVEAGRYIQAPLFPDASQLLRIARPDAVCVAVPTFRHAAVALEAIAAGCHLLIEKPLASTVAEGKAVVTAARRKGVELCVGHIERCNPAVLMLKEAVSNGQLGSLLQIHARRWSPFPERITDVGVVHDLATHDIDIMLFLTESRLLHASAEMHSCHGSPHEDLLSAVLRFENGAIGTLDINWLSPCKVRELAVLGDAGLARVNYLTQEVDLFLASDVEVGWEVLRILEGSTEARMVRLQFRRREPLEVELEAFVSKLDGGSPGVRLATGEDGLVVLEAAEQILRAGGRPKVEQGESETGEAGNRSDAS